MHDAGARGHDLYLEMLDKLYDDADSFPDCPITTPSGRVLVHRFMLHARLPHFGEPA